MRLRPAAASESSACARISGSVRPQSLTEGSFSGFSQVEREYDSLTVCCPCCLCTELIGSAKKMNVNFQDASG